MRPANGRQLRLLAPVAAILCLAALSQARASIRVSGDAPRAALWQKLYDQLPIAWKSNKVVVIHEVTDREMDRLVDTDPHQARNMTQDDDSIVDGYYQCGVDDDDPPVITLRRSLRGDAAELVFTHEYGHFVWDEKLTANERASYRKLWAQQKRAKRLVTEYAGDCTEEGFAEALAFFVRKPATLRKHDELSFQFFTNLLAH